MFSYIILTQQPTRLLTIALVWTRIGFCHVYNRLPRTQCNTETSVGMGRIESLMGI